MIYFCIKNGGFTLDNRKEKSKNTLKNALITCMNLSSFRDITVSQIVQIANVTRGTFYNHYDSKEQLLFELIDETLDEIKKEIRKPYEQFEHVRFNMFPKNDISLFYYLKEKRKLFQVLLKEAAYFDMHRFIADTIEEIYVEEYLFVLNNADANDKWFNVYSANGIAAIIMRWIEMDYQETPEEIGSQAIELMRTCSLGFNQRK